MVQILTEIFKALIGRGGAYKYALEDGLSSASAKAILRHSQRPQQTSWTYNIRGVKHAFYTMHSLALRRLSPDQ